MTPHQLAADGFRAALQAPRPAYLVRRSKTAHASLDSISTGGTGCVARRSQDATFRSLQPGHGAPGAGTRFSVLRATSSASDLPSRHLQAAHSPHTKPSGRPWTPALPVKLPVGNSSDSRFTPPSSQVLQSLHRHFQGNASFAPGTCLHRLLQPLVHHLVISRPVHPLQSKLSSLFGRRAVGRGFFTQGRAHGLSLSSLAFPSQTTI